MTSSRHHRGRVIPQGAAFDPRRYWKHSPWNIPTAGRSVDPDSATLISTWNSRGNILNPNVTTNGFSQSWSVGTVPPKYDVVQAIFPGTLDTQIPIRPGAAPSPDSDHHLAIFDPARNRVHEFWLMQYRAANDPGSVAPVEDSFNRANTGPPPSGDWSAWISDGLKVVSNQLAPNDTGDNGAYYKWGLPGPDGEVGLTVVTPPANGGETSIFIRLNPAGGAVVGTCYELHVAHASGTDTITINRFDGDDIRDQLATYSQEVAAGNKIRLRAVGSTLTAYYHNGTSWSTLGSVSDATYAGTGQNNKLGIYNYGNGGSGARYDDFLLACYQEGWLAGSGTSFDIDGRPITGEGSNAAGFPALACAIWPEEIQAGVIPHALAFSTIHAAPTVFRYPALHTDGDGAADDLQHGSWLAMPQGTAENGAWDSWVKIVFRALKDYGMFLQDQGGSLGISGVCPINGGVKWSAVGMGTDSDWSIGFPADFPWTSMQVLVAPSP